jgi:D-alanyl-D-alanine carboxypeptidase (penicillin-binding protein 5/6)
MRELLPVIQTSLLMRPAPLLSRMSLVAVFLTLLFSDPTVLFGGPGPERIPDPIPTPERITLALDSSLAYAPTLFRAGLVYDVAENKVVWEKGMNERMPIASLTKMMAALIVLEQAEAGNISLTDTVTISKLATYVGGSSIYFKQGQQFQVEELLGAAMIRSGNDAAYALAEHVSGSETAFVELMNQRAHILRMDSTVFFNSTGMPIKKGTDNTSTAADMLLLARELVKHDCMLEYTCKGQHCIRNANGLFTYDNRNQLVKQYDEVDGLKTGFTNAAGYCLVSTADRCGHRVITIVLGATNKFQRNDVAVNLFNNYYSSIGLGRLGEKFDTETALAD